MKTKKETKFEFEYIMKEVLNFKEDDEIMALLKNQKLTDIQNIITLPDEILTNLTTKLRESNRLVVLSRYVTCLERNNRSIKGDFMKIDMLDFDRFRHKIKLF